MVSYALKNVQLIVMQPKSNVNDRYNMEMELMLDVGARIFVVRSLLVRSRENFVPKNLILMVAPSPAPIFKSCAQQKRIMQAAWSQHFVSTKQPVMMEITALKSLFVPLFAYQIRYAVILALMKRDAPSLIYAWRRS